MAMDTHQILLTLFKWVQADTTFGNVKVPLLVNGLVLVLFELLHDQLLYLCFFLFFSSSILFFSASMRSLSILSFSILSSSSFYSRSFSS